MLILISLWWWFKSKYLIDSVKDSNYLFSVDAFVPEMEKWQSNIKAINQLETMKAIAVIDHHDSDIADLSIKDHIAWNIGQLENMPESIFSCDNFTYISPKRLWTIIDPSRYPTGKIAELLIKGLLPDNNHFLKKHWWLAALSIYWDIPNAHKWWKQITDQYSLSPKMTILFRALKLTKPQDTEKILLSLWAALNPTDIFNNIGNFPEIWSQVDTIVTVDVLSKQIYETNQWKWFVSYFVKTDIASALADALTTWNEQVYYPESLIAIWAMKWEELKISLRDNRWLKNKSHDTRRFKKLFNDQYWWNLTWWWQSPASSLYCAEKKLMFKDKQYDAFEAISLAINKLIT